MTRGASNPSVRLRDLAADDLPLVERWFRADHVRLRWGEPEENLRLLSEAPASEHWRAVVEADGRPVGLVLWQHPSGEELDVAGLVDVPTSAIDIDIMIGEPSAIGRGAGTAAIRLVAEAALRDAAVPCVMACPHVDNLASQRAFTKAGFQIDRQFDDGPCGPHVLMVRRRQEAEGR